MGKRFVREDRYIVIKRDDVTQYLDSDQSEFLEKVLFKIEALRIEAGRRVDKFVCVADDWPEYETVWKMLEDRISGSRNTVIADEVTAGAISPNRGRELLKSENFIDLPILKGHNPDAAEKHYLHFEELKNEAGEFCGVRIHPIHTRKINLLAAEVIADQQEEICQLRQLVEAHSQKVAFPVLMRDAIQHAIECTQQFPNTKRTVEQLQKLFPYCGLPLGSVTGETSSPDSVLAFQHFLDGYIKMKAAEKQSHIQKLLERGERLRNIDGWNEYGEDMIKAARMLQGYL